MPRFLSYTIARWGQQSHLLIAAGVDEGRLSSFTAGSYGVIRCDNPPPGLMVCPKNSTVLDLCQHLHTRIAPSGENELVYQNFTLCVQIGIGVDNPKGRKRPIAGTTSLASH